MWRHTHTHTQCTVGQHGWLILFVCNAIAFHIYAERAIATVSIQPVKFVLPLMTFSVHRQLNSIFLIASRMNRILIVTRSRWLNDYIIFALLEYHYEKSHWCIRVDREKEKIPSNHGPKERANLDGYHLIVLKKVCLPCKYILIVQICRPHFTSSSTRNVPNVQQQYGSASLEYN